MSCIVFVIDNYTALYLYIQARFAIIHDAVLKVYSTTEIVSDLLHIKDDNW